MDNPIFEKKNVLVTGGAGFIGSHLCERLLKEAKVICVDNFSNSRPENISHLLQYPDFEFIKYDINQPIDLDQFDELDKFKVKFQGIQEIYHLACPTSPKQFEANKIVTLWTNAYGTINTLELAAKHRAKYLFTSSAVIYGNQADTTRQLAETDLGEVNQLSDRASFDEGKRFAEAAVATYSQVHGLDAKIARVFTTYGPHMRLFEQQLIPDFILSALEGRDLVLYGDKDFSTSLCYVTDMVDALVRCMSTGPEVKVVNIGGDQVHKYTDVAEKIIAMTNSASQLRFDKPITFLTKKGAPDLTFAKEALGWFPLVRLEDGLRKTIDYVISHKEELRFDHDRKN
ncbi:MAG: NAD-dependent epimerase/dehydratase family protein [Candidatus Magasanikbacteria bacterium]|nr:NAD-dependent epimerase/dehydratase family protein [Candidatus Magasanikbacteria bacterium]